MCERQHVLAPRTQLAVVGDGDEIVGVVGAHHYDAIHWVLWTDKEIANECCMEVVMCV